MNVSDESCLLDELMVDGEEGSEADEKNFIFCIVGIVPVMCLCLLWFIGLSVYLIF